MVELPRLDLGCLLHHLHPREPSRGHVRCLPPRFSSPRLARVCRLDPLHLDLLLHGPLCQPRTTED